MASYLLTASFGRFDVHRWSTASGMAIIDAVDSRIDGALRRRIDTSLGKQDEMLDAQTRWFGRTRSRPPAGWSTVCRSASRWRTRRDPSTYRRCGTGTHRVASVTTSSCTSWRTGDSVALRRWRDIWLNEGVATYAEWLWNGREHDRLPRRFFRHYYAKPADAPFWNLRIGSNPGPEKMFNLSVYIRGALTLQALRRRIDNGADLFAVLRRWAQRNRDGHGTTPQFIRLAEQVSGRSLDGLLDAWLLSGRKPRRPGGRSATAAAREASTEATDALVREWERGLRMRLRYEHGR